MWRRSPPRPPIFPLRELPRGLLTVVEEAANGRQVGFFPVPLNHITTHPAGRVWDGASANHPYIIRLESDGAPRRVSGGDLLLLG